MKIVSRQQAIEQKLTRYFTGKPCKHGHITEKLLSNRTCVECKRLDKIKWGSQPHIKSASIARANAHNKKHPEMHLARTRKRQAALLQRVPTWGPHAHLIIAKYQLANMLSQASGEPYHVDHIIPLQGKKVSGLHVFSNLRVIPGSDNSKKSNKFVV